MFKKYVCWFLMLLLLFLFPFPVSARSNLTKGQQKRAKQIVKVCVKNYEEYGVLPSVCLAQAFVESTMGDHCKSYNLWGIRNGKARYGSLKKGTLGYLKCINNGYYKKAPFEKDYKKQIRYIVDGGYCGYPDYYYKRCLEVIKQYDFTKYDKQLK